MKSIVTLALLIVLFSTVTAQTEKGKFLLGGSSNFTATFLKSQTETENYESDPVSASTIEFSPQFGYFVVNGLAIGLDVPISFSTEKDDGDKFKTSTWLVGPFVRSYLGGQNVKPFLQASIGFGKSKYDSNYEYIHYPDDITKFDLFGYEAGGGISMFINQHVAFDVAVGYASVRSKFKNVYKENAKTTVSGFGASFGLIVVL
ncbi:MAG: outer membrane beta-barrel protein [Mariniphaga sp.]|nr:outer membrane beta-barrel protein [Mariniphaga sp.]